MKNIRVDPVKYISAIVLVFITSAVFLCTIVSATETQDILKDATENIHINGTNFDFYEKAEAVLSDNNKTNANDVFSYVIDLLFSEIKENLHMLTKIAILCIVSGILSTLIGEEISNVCFIICLILITTMVIGVLKNVLETAETTIDNLLIFMQSLIPAVSMLSAGRMATIATAFHPSLFISMQIIIFACKQWFLPMILFISVLSIINSMTTHFHITKLLETCRLFIKWGLGILMTVYVAFLGIHGFGTALQAGAVSKTVKYAIGTFIPIVGSVLSESAESVLAGFYLIKNAVGITGIMAILAIAIGPLVNILTTSVIFRLSASICEPAADKRIIKVVSDLAGNVSLVFSILLMVCAMAIISIAMLLLLTNTGTF